MFSKKVLNTTLVLGLSVGLMACGTTTKKITFKTPDGKIIDQMVERKDASHAMAPSTAMLFDVNPTEVKLAAYAAGATPMEQAAPMVSAGILGAAAIEAAERRDADVTNVSASAASAASQAQGQAQGQLQGQLQAQGQLMTGNGGFGGPPGHQR